MVMANTHRSKASCLHIESHAERGGERQCEEGVTLDQVLLLLIEIFTDAFALPKA